MEFTDLSRYRTVREPRVLPFAQLRTMQPLWMTQDLKLADEPDNIAYADQLARDGVVLVPIRKRPPAASYLDRETFPRRVIFEMTSRCNFLCRMCPQQNLKRPRMDMDGALYRK